MNKSPRFFYGYVIVAAGFIILLAMDGSIYTFGIFIEPLTGEFGWSRAEIAGAYSLLNILSGFCYIITGRLTDRYGPRLVLTVSGILLGVGYILASEMNTLWQLYLTLGVLAGIGDSGGFVPLQATAARWFTKRRGLMSGIVISGIGAGAMVMPVLASRLIVSYDWRTSYLIIGIIVIAVVVSAAQFLKRDPSEMKLKPYGAAEVKQPVPPLELTGFPLKKAVQTRQFLMMAAMLFCFGFGQISLMTHVVPDAIGSGIVPLDAANIMAVIGGLSVIGRIGMGIASDRVGNKRTAIISYVLLTASMLLAIFATQLWEFFLSGALFGFGYGALVTVLSPMVAELFGLKSLGAILGALIFTITIGGAIGPLVTGRMYDVSGSYFSAFVLCTILMGAGLVIAAMLKVASSQKSVVQ